MTSQAVEGHGSARVVTGGSGMNEGLIIPLCWHDTLWPLLRIAGFLPASWPVQWSSVEVTSKYRPTHLPWWQLTRILSLFSMPIVLAVVVSSSNLVPSVGTMGMQCVGILYCLDLIEIPSYPFSLFKAERSKIMPCTAVNPSMP